MSWLLLDAPTPRPPSPAAAGLVTAALIALALGLAVYLLDRPAGHAALLPAAWSAATAPGVFGALGGWWPSFAHPFAFALLGQACCADGRRPAWGVCVGWWAVNMAFECAQHPAVAPTVAVALLAGFGAEGVAATLARPVAAYLLRGTFDPGDLVAATLGALAAAGLIARARAVRAGHAG
jgi:hypothetical protein